MGLFTIYIRKDREPVFEQVKEIAKRERKPVAEIIFELLEEYVKEHGQGNPSFKLDDFVEKKVIEALPTLGHDPKAFNLKNYTDAGLERIKERALEWAEEVELELARRAAKKQPEQKVEWFRYRCRRCSFEFKWTEGANRCPKCGTHNTVECLGPAQPS